MTDYSAWPYCSPDWNDSDFFTASTAFGPTIVGSQAIDFPCDMRLGHAMSLPILLSIVALIFCGILYALLLKKPKGPETDDECQPARQDDPEKNVCLLTKDEQMKIGKEMNNIASKVQEGASAFLKEEYFWLSLFVAGMFVTLFLMFTLDDHRTDRTDGIRIAASFFVGAGLSAMSGYIGMVVATDANVRTTQAARDPVDGGNEGGGLNAALRVAFTGGAVMGFTVVGLGLFGLALFFLIMSAGRDCEDYSALYGGTEPLSCESPAYEDSLDAMAGFGFGASSIALFARVAGGIYTKAADVGADLVGKIESGIPEDSAENPATIADNVGDNVGDVAGMGADLFESFVGSIIACATLAEGDIAKIAFPFWLAGAGVLASIVGFFFVSIEDNEVDEHGNMIEKYRLTVKAAESNPDHADKFEDPAKLAEDAAAVRQNQTSTRELKAPYFKKGEHVWINELQDPNCDQFHEGNIFPVIDDNAQQEALMWGLHKGSLSAAVLLLGFAAIECYLLFDYSDYQDNQTVYYKNGTDYKNHEAWRIYGCVLIGLGCGIIIGQLTEYCTSYSYAPVKSISKAGVTGPATVIIQGLGVGMISCMPPTLVLVGTILACDALMRDYGVAVAAVGMLSTLGLTLATDAYGPIADNAGGCAEMIAELPNSVRATTDALDALGNTTAATGKGFAIGSAVLTSLSLLNAFEDRVSAGVTIDTSVSDSVVLAGIVLGAMLPFLFGALTMISVGIAAQDLMIEVRRQFEMKRKNENALIENAVNNMMDKDCLNKSFTYVDEFEAVHDQEKVGNRRRVPKHINLCDVPRSTPTYCHPIFMTPEWITWRNEDHWPADAETADGKKLKNWEPESTKCIEISTKASINEMVLPGCYAIFTPVLVGFLVGARCLMGVLAGSVGAGAMMAIMMSNAGGAWDNSKKFIEIAGAHGGKGTDIHKACVVGDTVGDPFKDTSGPALNILLKLMAVVSLTISTFLKGRDDWELWKFMFIPLIIMGITTFLVFKLNYNKRTDPNDPEKTIVAPSPKKMWFSTDGQAPMAPPAAQQQQHQQV